MRNWSIEEETGIPVCPAKDDLVLYCVYSHSTILKRNTGMMCLKYVLRHINE